MRRMTRTARRLLAWQGLFLAALAAAAGPVRAADSPAAGVRDDAAQAEAALAILAKAGRGEPIGDADWQRLFDTEGYRRLRERETSMGRPFEEGAFREFLLADTTLARAAALDSTLGLWRGTDPADAARLALRYLPAGTKLRATVYFTVKPRSNSFVYDLSGNPGIFLHLDPSVPPERLTNTVAHELHHVGYAQGCIGPPPGGTPAHAEVRRWLGAFGEGAAVLAATVPGQAPDQTWTAADRAEWARDLADPGPAFAALERFFLALADGTLSAPDSIRAAAMPFYGNRGPWYTVGYRMCADVERALGRARLVEALCDPVRLPRLYNEAARILDAQDGGRRPMWSGVMLTMLGGVPARNE